MELSRRKNEILKELAQGKTDMEIAETLSISVNTVKTHLKQVYKILEVKNRVQASMKYNELLDKSMHS